MTAIEKEHVAVGAEDGTEMDMYVAYPDPEHDRHVGVLVLQEIFGVKENIRDIADRFARLGYTSVAPDLFHRTQRGFDVAYTAVAEARKVADAYTDAQLCADLDAAYGWVRDRLLQSTDEPKIVAAGFCLGGAQAFRANALLPLSAALCFYGRKIAESYLPHAAEQHGPCVLLWGGSDPSIPAGARRSVADALEAAGKTYVDIVFGEAQHAFMREGHPPFHADAAREAWALVTTFLSHRVG